MCSTSVSVAVYSWISLVGQVGVVWAGIRAAVVASSSGTMGTSRSDTSVSNAGTCGTSVRSGSVGSGIVVESLLDFVNDSRHDEVWLSSSKLEVLFEVLKMVVFKYEDVI